MLSQRSSFDEMLMMATPSMLFLGHVVEVSDKHVEHRGYQSGRLFWSGIMRAQYHLNASMNLQTV